MTFDGDIKDKTNKDTGNLDNNSVVSLPYLKRNGSLYKSESFYNDYEFTLRDNNDGETRIKGSKEVSGDDNKHEYNSKVAKVVDEEEDGTSFDIRFKNEIVLLKPKFSPFISGQKDYSKDSGLSNGDTGGIYTPRTSMFITRTLITTADCLRSEAKRKNLPKKNLIPLNFEQKEASGLLSPEDLYKKLDSKLRDRRRSTAVFERAAMMKRMDSSIKSRRSSKIDTLNSTSDSILSLSEAKKDRQLLFSNNNTHARETKKGSEGIISKISTIANKNITVGENLNSNQGVGGVFITSSTTSHPNREGRITISNIKVEEGIRLLDKMDYEGSRAKFDRAIYLDGKNGEAYLNRGVLNEREGKYSDALIDLNNARRLLPRNALVHYNRGIVNLRLNRDTEAWLDLCKAIDINSTSYPQFFAMKALILRRQGKFSDAMGDYVYLTTMNIPDEISSFNTMYARSQSFDISGITSYEDVFDSRIITTRSKDIQDALEKAPSKRTDRDIDILFSITDLLPSFFHRFSVTETRNLWKYIRYEYHEAGNRVFDFGDKGDKFFIILSGSVSVRLSVEKSRRGRFGSMSNLSEFVNEVQVQSISKPGSTFGEIAIGGNGTRSASVVTTSESEFLTLSKQEYELTIALVNAKELEIRTEILINSKIFESIGEETIKRLAKGSNICSFDRGTSIFKRQDDANDLFIIYKGMVKCVRQIWDETDGRTFDVELTKLSHGDVLGEVVIFDPVVSHYQYSAICDTPVKVLVIPKSQIDYSIDINNDVEKAIRSKSVREQAECKLVQFANDIYRWKITKNKVLKDLMLKIRLRS